MEGDLKLDVAEAKHISVVDKPIECKLDIVDPKANPFRGGGELQVLNNTSWSIDVVSYQPETGLSAFISLLVSDASGKEVPEPLRRFDHAPFFDPGTPKVVATLIPGKWIKARSTLLPRHMIAAKPGKYSIRAEFSFGYVAVSEPIIVELTQQHFDELK